MNTSLHRSGCARALAPRSLAWVVLALAASGCQAAQVIGRAAMSDGVEVPIPADLRARTDEAEARGATIYALDRAAAISTDEVIEESGRDNPANLGGWITYGERNQPDSLLTEFYTDTDPPRVAFRVRVSSLTGVVSSLERVDPTQPIDPTRLILWRARQTAIASLQDFPQTLNSVLIPAPDDSVYVYLLAASTQPDVAVLGQHHRFKIAGADGTTILEKTALTNTALELPLRPVKDPSEAILFVTHVVTDYPLETHVFASFLYRRTLCVITERGVWTVIAGKISYLGTREAVLGPDQ